MNIKNKIFFFNILLFMTVLCIFLFYNQSLPLCEDDTSFPFFQHWDYTRIPPFFLCKLYFSMLPSLLNIHPADSRIDYIICPLAGMFYISIVLFYN